MGYYFDSRVRFSETGTDGKLTLPGMLNYFQDCCTFQAESIHQGTRELVARNRVWVLNSWQVIVNRYPEEGEWIRTTTFPYKLSMCFGHRNFKMETEDGEVLSMGNTLWTYLNIKTGRPERLTEEDLRGYVLDEKLDMPYTGRKILMPEGAEKKESFVIQKHHLDVNHHVNNCQYVSMALDYLPDGAVVTGLRSEYHRQAFQGDVFCPSIAETDNKTIVMFHNTEGDLYASVECIYSI